jgi:tricorn protease interacting factor F2/3
LGPEDRWGLENDLYALVRQGRRPLGDYLAFLQKYYLEEKAYLPLASSAGHLFQALLVAPAAGRTPIAALGRELAGNVLARIGLTPAASEPHTTAILRDQLLWQGAVWGLQKALDFGQEQFQRLTAGQAVPPDIAKAVMQIGAWTRAAEALAWFRQRYQTSPSEHERLNILAALGAFRSWEQTAAGLAFCLGEVPPRNRFIPIVAAAANPLAQDHLWAWYQDSLSTLENFHPLLYERVITAIVPSGGLGREAEVQRFFESYVQRHPNLADAVSLALEHLRINGRMQATSKV